MSNSNNTWLDLSFTFLIPAVICKLKQRSSTWEKKLSLSLAHSKFEEQSFYGKNFNYSLTRTQHRGAVQLPDGAFKMLAEHQLSLTPCLEVGRSYWGIF